jgi:hypothetical protein
LLPASLFPAFLSRRARSLSSAGRSHQQEVPEAPLSEVGAERIGREISSCIFRATAKQPSDKWPSDEAHQPRLGPFLAISTSWPD